MSKKSLKSWLKEDIKVPFRKKKGASQEKLPAQNDLKNSIYFEEGEEW